MSFLLQKPMASNHEMGDVIGQLFARLNMDFPQSQLNISPSQTRHTDKARGSKTYRLRCLKN